MPWRTSRAVLTVQLSSALSSYLLLHSLALTLEHFQRRHARADQETVPRSVRGPRPALVLRPKEGRDETGGDKGDGGEMSTDPAKIAPEYEQGNGFLETGLRSGSERLSGSSLAIWQKFKLLLTGSNGQILDTVRHVPLCFPCVLATCYRCFLL